jgi:hypothetical protein
VSLFTSFDNFLFLTTTYIILLVLNKHNGDDSPQNLSQVKKNLSNYKIHTQVKKNLSHYRIHTHTYTYTHARAHTHIHTHTHTLTHTLTHTHTLQNNIKTPQYKLKQTQCKVSSYDQKFVVSTKTTTCKSRRSPKKTGGIFIYIYI